MSIGPYPWRNPTNTSNQIAGQSQSTYKDYKKIKGFEDVGYFLLYYIVSGGVVTSNATRNDMIDATDIVVSLNDDIMARDGYSFQTSIPSTTYYLDFAKDGDWSWGTIHAEGVVGADYLTVAEVTTDGAGLVSSIVDKRGTTGGFRLKDGFGLDQYVTKGSIVFNIKDYGATGNGVTNDSVSIATAISAAVAAGGGTVFVPAGIYSIASSLTIPSNVTIWFTNGAVFNISTGITLTVNGFIEAALSQVFSGAGTVNGAIKNEAVYPQWWGADSTGVSDSTAAINKALLAHMVVHLTAGDFRVAGTVAVVRNGQKLIGSGVYSTKLIATSTNLPLISVNVGLNWLTVSDMMLDRTAVAVNGGNGINCTGVVSNTNFLRMIIQKQARGLNLGCTDWSTIKDIVVQNCRDHAIIITSNMGVGGLWQISDVLASQNDGSGIAVRVTTGATASFPLGEWTNISTFANTGSGISIVGTPTTSITSVRIKGGFLGADNAHEIYLDTYGGAISIADLSIEQGGTQYTGSSLQTAPINVANGIYLSANNLDCTISNCWIVTNSLNGIYTEAKKLIVTGSRIYNNGVAGTAGNRNGIVSFIQDACVISGNSIGNTGGGGSQLYGAYIGDGSKVILYGNDLSLNGTAGILAVTNETYLNAFGNLPNTVPNVVQGGVLVGAGAVGGVPAYGEINVQQNIKKNNTVYTNP